MDAHGVSLRQLAAQMGRSHNYVGLRMRGVTDWRVSDLEALAKALGVTPTWLVERAQAVMREH